MTRRTALTAGAAAGLTGLYVAYANTVTPLLESAAEKAKQAADDVATGIIAPASNRELAERFLPHAPFAAEADYQIGSGPSMMYWNEWEIIKRGEDETALQVKPFAIIVIDDQGTDPETGGKPPTTIVADTALLRFEQPISEEMVSSPGRVVAGVFRGAVRVDGEDGLRLIGSDFLYREGEPSAKFAGLYSDRPVQFWHGGRPDADSPDGLKGGHEGSGDGVEVKLFRTRSPAAYDNVAADGLAEVDLRGPVDLTLRGGGGLPGLDAAGGPLDQADGGPTNEKPEQKNRQPVHITATGRLLFNPDANTALFTSLEPGGVRAWRDQPPDAKPPTPERAGPDELIADDLLVTFSPSTEAAKQEAAETRAARANRDWGDRSFYGADDDLEATAVIADGAPVRVISPARQVRTTSARLEHDVRTDVLTLIGDPRSRTAGVRRAAAVKGETEGLVRVTLPNAVIRCPRLVVMPPEAPAGVDWKTVDAPRRLRCSGPGQLRRTDPQTGELAAEVVWPGTLVTSRNPNNDLDVVTLTGKENPRRNEEGQTVLADQTVVQTFAEGSAIA
ncbi:MAG: hypothetical protein AAF907_06475, partial [Planctomycetota bacterium]